jgi:hypothetical protein
LTASTASGGQWSSGGQISGLAVNGTPISVAWITAPELNVFYIDNATLSLYGVTYNPTCQHRNTLLPPSKFLY